MEEVKIKEFRIPEEMDEKTFTKFLIQKHKEILELTKINPEDTETINWTTLNKKIENYAVHRSWSIIEYWLAKGLEKKVKDNYKEWYNQHLLYTKEILKKEGQKNAPQYLIEAKMEELFGSRIKYWNTRLRNLELLIGFYKDFRDLWRDQIQVYQTLSANIRSEFENMKIEKFKS